MTITELGDLLRANPMAWRDIPEDQRQIAEAALLPKNGFDEAQRAWLAQWWLQCTQADVDAINACLPRGTAVSPISVDGVLYLGGDLLTDSLGPGGTYFPATALLQALTCTSFVYAPPAVAA